MILIPAIAAGTPARAESGSTFTSGRSMLSQTTENAPGDLPADEKSMLSQLIDYLAHTTPEQLANDAVRYTESVDWDGFIDSLPSLFTLEGMKTGSMAAIHEIRLMLREADAGLADLETTLAEMDVEETMKEAAEALERAIADLDAEALFDETVEWLGDLLSTYLQQE